MDRKPLELTDLPPLPPGATVDILERIRQNDMNELAAQYARAIDKGELFHAIQCCGMFRDVGCFVTIGSNRIPYVVTRINPAEHQIFVTKWDFWEKTDGHRTIELVSSIQNPDTWNPIKLIEGHFSNYEPKNQPVK